MPRHAKEDSAVEDSAMRRPQRTGNRIPLREQGPLTFDNQDPNFVYHVVNDRAGSDRVGRFQKAGWEIVENETIGEDGVRTPGTITSRPVNSDGTQGVLMKIKKEWYLEDQAAKQAEIDKIEDTIKRTEKQGGMYGENNGFHRYNRSDK